MNTVVTMYYNTMHILGKLAYVYVYENIKYNDLK